MDRLRKPRIEFLGEQVGPAEDAIKRALEPLLLGNPDVSEAYLAQVGYRPDESRSVALCLAPSAAHSESLLLGVSAVARRVLAKDVSLDVIFVSEAQLEDLRRVCRPFFARAT
jgi:hypothetical protein